MNVVAKGPGPSAGAPPRVYIFHGSDSAAVDEAVRRILHVVRELR